MVFRNRLKRLHRLLIAFSSNVILKFLQATTIEIASLVVERGRKRVLEKHPGVSLL
jgi:hypothetical protein